MRFKWWHWMKFFFVVLTLAWIGCSSPSSDQPKPPEPEEPSYEQMVAQFDYDARLPLDIQETLIENRGNSQIHHLSYASPKGGRVPSLLVVPAGSGPFAALVFLHWGQGDMYEFLDESLQIAPLGVVSIMITAPAVQNYGSSEQIKASYIQTVVALRRAVDLLLARGDVDLGRIGYVGHSHGATWGGVLAGVDKRLQAYVLMCGHPELGECGACNQRLVPSSLWASKYIGHATPAALLFQFALRDKYITIEAANLYFELASEPKSILWYDTGHPLDQQAQLDRIEWLKGRLGL